MRLIVVKLSWNREIVEELVCNDYRTDFQAIIEDLIGDDVYCPCLGFSDQDTSGVFDVFYRLRKNDIPFILIEKYNGSLIFRARNCKFVFQRNGCDSDKNEIFRNNCEHCKDIYTQMDLKYSFGRFTKANNQTIISYNKTEDNLIDTLLPKEKDPNIQDKVEVSDESERVEAFSESEASKRPRRDSRTRKSGSKYKDFVVELGTIEGPNSQEHTTSIKKDTNEDIENIENLPLNVRNQEVRLVDIILFQKCNLKVILKLKNNGMYFII